MTATRFTIDPDAVLDYEFDWTAWLDAGETIGSYEVVPSAGITVDSHSKAGGVVTVWVSGAQPRNQRLTCRIVTSQGRTDDRSINLFVIDR